MLPAGAWTAAPPPTQNYFELASVFSASGLTQQMQYQTSSVKSQNPRYNRGTSSTSNSTVRGKRLPSNEYRSDHRNDMRNSNSSSQDAHHQPHNHNRVTSSNSSNTAQLAQNHSSFVPQNHQNIQSLSSLQNIQNIQNIQQFNQTRKESSILGSGSKYLSKESSNVSYSNYHNRSNYHQEQGDTAMTKRDNDDNYEKYGKLFLF